MAVLFINQKLQNEFFVFD